MESTGKHIRTRRRFQAVLSRGSVGTVLALFLLWCAGLGLQVHVQSHRAIGATRALGIIQQLRDRALEAGSAGDPGRSECPPLGLLARLDHRDDVEGLWTRVRDTWPADSATRSASEQAHASLDLLLDRARRTTMAEIEVKLARTGGEPAAIKALQDTLAASRELLTAQVARFFPLLSRLEEWPAQTLRTADVARLCDLLLASTASLLALVFWRYWRTRLHRNKHLKGARLVEEMLEAYSRRLETMNAELEQVSLLKTQFLANTSHELLTPLNGIMGSLELLDDDGHSSAEERREWLKQASQSAERLHALIQDLLDLCRLEEGDLALRCRSLDFGSLLDRSVARHRAAMQERGLTLLVTAPASGWPRVLADSRRLEQVLQHVLANALKFTEKGSIRITGRIETEEGPQVRVEVSDTGIGIPAQKLPRVFELFSQVDGTNARRFGGTGLGLTLCRHLIQGMSGRIGIDSEGDGRGTRVWFTLPLALAEIETDPGPDSEGHKAA